MELRLSPKVHPLSDDGQYTHVLRLIENWDDWSEDTLNTIKDEDGSLVDDNGRPSPRGMLLHAWKYQQGAQSISINIDAYGPVGAYKLEAVSRQLIDDQLTLRIDPGNDAIGFGYYHSNEREWRTDQPSFIVENAYDKGSGELIVQNWLIGSSGAIDPTDRSLSEGTVSSAENKVRLDIDGNQHWSLHDAQLAARRTHGQPYSDYEYREYWLGDTDRRMTMDSDDQVQSDPDWRNQFNRSAGFDSRPYARVVPFTFEFQGVENW